MDMFDEARAMSGTLELCRITQKELADRMGVSQSYVANKLRLLALSPYMEKLIKKNPNIKLLLVGNIGSQEYYDHFKSLLDKSPAKDHVIHVDYFDHRYMGEFLRRCADIFILPTMQEGCSNAVLEAIYCDKPMIITDVGNAQQAKTEASCIVVPTPYPDIVTLKPQELNEMAMRKDMPNQAAVVDAILEMVADLPAYCEKAKLTPEQKQQFSEQQMVNAYVDVLRELNHM